MPEDGLIDQKHVSLLRSAEYNKLVPLISYINWH